MMRPRLGQFSTVPTVISAPRAPLRAWMGRLAARLRAHVEGMVDRFTHRYRMAALFIELFTSSPRDLRH